MTTDEAFEAGFKAGLEYKDYEEELWVRRSEWGASGSPKTEDQILDASNKTNIALEAKKKELYDRHGIRRGDDGSAPSSGNDGG